MKNLLLALGLTFRLVQKQFLSPSYQQQIYPGFLSEEQVKTINQKIDAIKLEDTELDRSAKKTQVIRRHDGYDNGMIDIWGINYTITDINELADMDRLQTIINLHDKYHLKRVNVYLNNGITQTRGFHVDSLGHRQIKCFIYLTDVLNDNDGPYTYVPNSQQYFWRTLANIWYSTIRFKRPTDMQLFTGTHHKFHGQKGDLIITSQDGYHRGWPQHKNAKRRLLVFVFNKGS